MATATATGTATAMVVVMVIAMATAGNHMGAATIKMDVAIIRDQKALLRITKLEIPDTATRRDRHATDPHQCYRVQVSRVSILLMATNHPMIQSLLEVAATVRISEAAIRQILALKIAPWIASQSSQKNIRVRTTRPSAIRMDHSLLFLQTIPVSKISGEAQVRVRNPHMGEMNF